jgi:hypothetical protein
MTNTSRRSMTSGRHACADGSVSRVRETARMRRTGAGERDFAR